MKRHPLTGYRLVRNHVKPFWEKTDVMAPCLVSLTESPEDFDRFRTTPVDPSVGPVISICIMRGPDRDSMIAKCHHSFCDVGGIKEFTYQLSDIYMKGGKDRQASGGLSNFGIIERERILFGAHPERAYILPPVFRLPAFAMCARGFDGTLTLSAGIYDCDPLVKSFIDEITEQLAALQ
jgi:NRPS condensation-like uncharacterized protein